VIISLDLEAAAVRQKKFLESIRSLMKPDRETIVNLIKQYKKWLKLVRKFPGEMMVPTVGIDLIWHTHMRIPQIYEIDTRQIVGKFLDHDDATPDTDLEKYLDRTQEHWKKRYHEEYLAERGGGNCGGGGSCSSKTSGNCSSGGGGCKTNI